MHLRPSQPLLTTCLTALHIPAAVLEEVALQVSSRQEPHTLYHLYKHEVLASSSTYPSTLLTPRSQVASDCLSRAQSGGASPEVSCALAVLDALPFSSPRIMADKDLLQGLRVRQEGACSTTQHTHATLTVQAPTTTNRHGRQGPAGRTTGEARGVSSTHLVRGEPSTPHPPPPLSWDVLYHLVRFQIHRRASPSAGLSTICLSVTIFFGP